MEHSLDFCEKPELLQALYCVLLLLLTCLAASPMCSVIYCTAPSIYLPLRASLWLCLRNCILPQNHSHKL